MRSEDGQPVEATTIDGLWNAFSRNHAVLETDADGWILRANSQFLDLLGYDVGYLVGRHHDVLCGGGRNASAWNEATWRRLRAGETVTGDFSRLADGGRPVVLRTILLPTANGIGVTTRVLSVVVDISLEGAHQAECEWQVAAIPKSHLTITFDTAGLIIDANTAFLEALGYEREEVVGRHHRMFVDPSQAHDAEYAAFWSGLAAGGHRGGQFRHLAKDRSAVWLQATYSPVLDSMGRPAKVVGRATIVTGENLTRTEHQGQIAAMHKALCVVSFDLDGIILDANDNFLNAVGYSLSELRGRPHQMLVQCDYAESDGYSAFWSRLTEGHHHVGEYKRIGKNGVELWMHGNYNPILDAAGRPFRVVKYGTVITSEKLRRADFEAQIVAINKSQGVIAFDLDGVILEANDNAARFFGYMPESLRGERHELLVPHDECAGEEYLAFWAALRKGTFLCGLYRRLHLDGSAVWIQASYNPIFDLEGRPFKIIEIATDVTSNVALAEAYADSQRRAQHDPATALPNRARLISFMHAVMERAARRLVLLYIDVDGLKPINETYGFQVGDRILGQFADRLRRTLTPEQLAARIGDAEFVVAAPDACDDEAGLLCQRLLTAVSAPISYAGVELGISLRVGLATSEDADTPDELIRCADIALNRSKEQPPGSVSFYASASNQRFIACNALVAGMRRSLQAGDFVIDYQPRFDTASGRLRSAEALVRWNHPQRGRIGPAEFIPAAERSGVIVELGEWVLLEACRTASSWPDVGVSVNVSPRQFHASDIVAVVGRVLEATGLRPDLLELELTEGVVLTDTKHAQVALARLKSLGVRIAMDDFGTGYSSLSTLRTFPFDVVKIDRQFIQDMDTRDNGREVVQAMLALACAFGLVATAEGVESAEQLEMLAADGCPEVQGYLLSRPLTAVDFTAMVEADGASRAAKPRAGGPRAGAEGKVLTAERL